MDRNISMERRFSLNATPIANPIAESTCLNINNRSSPSFQWGGTTISPKNRSNSSICLSSSSKSNQYNTASSRDGNRSIYSRSNTTTIDPRVYADVQSKGLASRIVKYNEKGTSLSRSFSVNNLYTKPGQFPVVNLKKTELPQRSYFTKLSMTRIAPPEKSMFYGNTLPSVLRSNSVVAMHKSDEEISSENRPILHPPPTENEMAPTRSVLEVLKEISRKRINSDDHLELDDSTKKYCNRKINEQTYVTPNAQSNNKRQREHLNGQMQLSQPQQHITNNLTTHNSPEHLAKKRLCSYNNDITSSLSSSQIHANKRKLYEQTRDLVHMNSAEEVDHRSAKKLQLQKSEASSEQLFSTLNNKSSSISTPTEQSYNEDIVERNAIVGPTFQANAQPPHRDTNASEIVNSKGHDSIKKKKLTLFNKDYDEGKQEKAFDQFSDNGPTENGDFCSIPFVKPKKNTSSSIAKNPIIERTQKSKLALMLSGLRGDLYYSDEDQVDEAKKKDDKKAPVSPEKENKIAAETLAPSNSAETPSITENQIQIKYASNLTSENVTTTKSSVVGNSFSKPVSTLLQTAVNSESTELNTQSKAINALPTYSGTKGELNNVSNTNGCASTKVNMTQSPLVGIKLTPQSTTPSSFINASNVNTQSSTKNPPALQFNANPTVSAASSSSMGGFSFNLTSTPTTVAEDSKKLQPKISSTSTASFNSSTSNGFTIPVTTLTSGFGQNTQHEIQSVSPFTFGSLTSSTADAKQPIAKTSDFEAVKSINFAQISTAPAIPAASSKPFGFESISSANTVTTVPSSTNNGFSFGIKNTQTQKPLAVATPFTMNSSGLTQQSIPKSVNSFSFAGSTYSSDPTTSAGKSGQISFGETSKSTNSFNFGGAAATSASFTFGSNFTATSSQAKTVDAPSKAVPFTFGGNSAASLSANKNAGFAFENAPTSRTSEQTSTNIFGSSNIQPSTATPSFNFGGTELSTTMAAPCSSNIFGAPPIATANPQNKAFSFGSSVTSITSPKSESGGFSFNTANKPNSGGFSFSTNTASDAGQTSNTLPTFRFGSLAPNDGSSKNFQAQTATTDNSAGLKQTSSPPPFSFTTNTQTNVNTFAPPQQNTISGIGDRPFRRATRRLPKS